MYNMADVQGTILTLRGSKARDRTPSEHGVYAF